jgi:hypothetical protein
VKKLLLICIAGLGCLPLFAAEPVNVRPFTMSGSRERGMGGPHVAFTDNVFSLFVNPAALQESNEKSFFEIGIGTHGPLLEIVDIVKSAQGSGDQELVNQIGTFAKQSGGKIPLGAEVRFPLSIGYTANGLGFGVWNKLWLDTKIIGTDIEAEAAMDFVLNFGMSVNIFTFQGLGSHVLDTGFVVKAAARGGVMGFDESLLNVLADGMMDKLIDEMNVPLLLGGGLDLGLTYRWKEFIPGNAFIAAIVVDDFPTLVSARPLMGKDNGTKYRVSPTVNIGAAYTFDLAALVPVPLDFAFAIDYHDISRWFTPNDFTKRNPVLNLSLGLEITAFKIISARFGMNEMLPAVGLGINLKGFKIEGALYGKELGIEPGQLPAYAFDLSISARPASKKRVWPWTQTSIVDAVGSLINKNKQAEQPAVDQAPEEEVNFF